MGRCPDCGGWNTLVEEKKSDAHIRRPAGPSSAPVPLDEIDYAESERFLTGIGEFDRVLGGGIVPGSVVLVGGEPAVGRETPHRAMIVDSIQTIFTNQLSSAPGSVSQVREAAAQLMNYAKKNAVPVFIVGHVTKDGSIAGPRVLEHIVDTVLYFEGDSGHSYRILRAVH